MLNILRFPVGNFNMVARSSVVLVLALICQCQITGQRHRADPLHLERLPHEPEPGQHVENEIVAAENEMLKTAMSTIILRLPSAYSSLNTINEWWHRRWSR